MHSSIQILPYGAEEIRPGGRRMPRYRPAAVPAQAMNRRAEVTRATHTAEHLRGRILKYGPDLQGPPPPPPGRNDRLLFLPDELRREGCEPGGDGGPTPC